MTRARDMANLGSQAGSGLDASDITSGVLPSGVTGGSGLTLSGTIGQISAFGVATAPTGWIICNGASLVRTGWINNIQCSRFRRCIFKRYRLTWHFKYGKRK